MNGNIIKNIYISFKFIDTKAFLQRQKLIEALINCVIWWSYISTYLIILNNLSIVLQKCKHNSYLTITELEIV